MTIEGVPEGFEIERIGKPRAGEWIIDGINGTACQSEGGNYNRVVLRKIEKPKTYRPFANAAEFKPHRDRWQTRKDISDKNQQPGACRPSGFDNVGMWFANSYVTYEDAFEAGKVFDDDGSPFGVEVVE